MSMCRMFSCVVGRGCLLWPVRSLGKTLLAFALLHSVLQGQISLLLQVSLDFLLLHSTPLRWKGHLLWLLVLEEASVFLMNIQNWFPLGLTGWISLLSKGLSRVFSRTTAVWKHQCFGIQPSILFTSLESHLVEWYCAVPLHTVFVHLAMCIVRF